MKTCTRCLQIFPLDRFHKDTQKNDGLAPQCKACKKLPPQHLTLEERFWAKVHKTETCWLWAAALWPNGYGHFAMPTHHALAHRVAWEFMKGPIPDNLDVLHDCPQGDNKACVNPDHLWLGTQKENAKDAVTKGQFKPGQLFQSGPQHPFFGKRQTHCKNGHQMTEDNTLVQRNGAVRRCKICTVAWHHNRNQKRRELYAHNKT